MMWRKVGDWVLEGLMLCLNVEKKTHHFRFARPTGDHTFCFYMGLSCRKKRHQLVTGKVTVAYVRWRAVKVRLHPTSAFTKTWTLPICPLQPNVVFCPMLSWQFALYQLCTSKQGLSSRLLLRSNSPSRILRLWSNEMPLIGIVVRF